MATASARGPCPDASAEFERAALQPLLLLKWRRGHGIRLMQSHLLKAKRYRHWTFRSAVARLALFAFGVLASFFAVVHW